VILDDQSIRYSSDECHAFDRAFYERADVQNAFRSARKAWDRARRTRRRFTPHWIALRPPLRRLREDREQITEREWARFEASGEGLTGQGPDDPVADESAGWPAHSPDDQLGGGDSDWLAESSVDWGVDT
jgi:hypothetical protein